LFYFQLTIQACDTGNPVRCANTTIIITVDRTGTPPIFQQTPYTKDIEENHDVGAFIFQVTANDNNKLVRLIIFYISLNYCRWRGC